MSFSLLSSAKEKNRRVPSAKVDRRTNGFKRRAESLRKAPEVLTLLLSQLEQLIKAFAELITTPIKEMLEEFMAHIPALFRRPMLLPAGVFQNIPVVTKG